MTATAGRHTTARRVVAGFAPRASRQRRSKAAWRMVGAACLASLITLACRDRVADRDAPRARAKADESSSASASPAADTGRLPEDPVAGAKAVAEWKQHLEREEQERRLSYDRRKLDDHRRVLERLRAARRSYDRAATARAVLAEEKRFRSTRPEIDALFEKIDHWGVNSKVLPDYRELVQTLSDAYPNARIAALSGDTTPLERAAREMDERLRGIDAWLGEAAEHEDE